MGQSSSTLADPTSDHVQPATHTRTRQRWSPFRRNLPDPQHSSAAYLTRTRISSRNSTERDQENPSERDEPGQVIVESEARLLRSMGDLHMPEAPINHISATPLPRPRSVVSRVAANIHHRYSTMSMDLGSSTAAWNNIDSEGVEHSAPPQRSASVRQRLSSLSHFRRSSHMSESPTDASRVLISRPILPPNDPSLNPAFGTTGALRRAPTPGMPVDQIVSSMNVNPRPVRHSRLTRFRQSISGPMDLFRNSFHYPQTQSRPSQRATSANSADESDYLIPPLVPQDNTLDMEDHTNLISRENNNSGIDQTFVDNTDRDTSPPRVSTTSSTSEYVSAPMEAQRIPRRRRQGSGMSFLRGRSSRLIRRDDDTPLSRVLQLAATAIAAQLSGNNDAIANLESVGDDQLDGNLNAFVEELNNAPGAPGTARDANTPPLNFWRVFRFDSNSNNRYGPHPGQIDELRTVTLVVVGVRSVPSSTINRNTGVTENHLENLLDLPRRRATFDPSFRPNDTSILGRHQAFTNNPVSLSEMRQNRNIADIVDFGPQPWSAPPSDSPPGPIPPPSTPADRLSLLPTTSQAGFASEPNENTRLSLPSLIRRRSGVPSTNASQQHENEATNSMEDLSSTDPSNQNSATPNQHYSDSETRSGRHPRLHRDDPRRHGFIGPSPDREGGGPPGRSWLIYVIGTNLAEDSPLLDMPNLFDLNGDSYEDMLRLSELIGSAKPATASEADVNAAGGLLLVKYRMADGTLFTEPVAGGSHSIEIPADATCIICQDKYAVPQEIRKLSKCPHFFHRGCVDTWLTQGKNTCPLCRHQGVDIQQPSSSNTGNNSEMNNLRDADIGRAI